MPNWSEGCLKVRGKAANVKKSLGTTESHLKTTTGNAFALL